MQAEMAVQPATASPSQVSTVSHQATAAQMGSLLAAAVEAKVCNLVPVWRPLAGLVTFVSLSQEGVSEISEEEKDAQESSLYREDSFRMYCMKVCRCLSRQLILAVGRVPLRLRCSHPDWCTVLSCLPPYLMSCSAHRSFDLLQLAGSTMFKKVLS